MVPSLLIVFVVAKAIALAGHDVPISWWSLIAFFWQDAAIVLLFAVLAAALKRRSTFVWGLYAALAIYAALNVPVTRVLSTPMTWAMWRAAGGPLSDSIVRYATWDNVLLTMTIAVLAIVLPLVFERTCDNDSGRPEGPRDTAVPAVAVLATFVLLGPVAAARVDTRGLERNAWTALVMRPAGAMRFSARSPDHGWTATGFEQTIDARLAQFRGVASGRHIVMVSLESTAAQYLGLYGANPDVMPNLSALAEHAIVFDQAYAVYPESIKGLFSILCSSYPAFDTAAESHDAVPCTSIARLLSQRGYRTALVHSGRFGYLGMDSIIRDRGFDILEDAGDIGGRRNSSFGVDEPSTVARILNWIDAVPAGDRFFVTYLPIAGHHPYDAPQPGLFPERTDFDRYRNALHDGDAALGTLIRGIRARGLEERTLWIVSGDHGEAFGQHDGNYGHTFQIFDENVRVPLIIAAPGVVARRLRSSQVVSLIDVAPTLLDLIGEPVPEFYEGRSMLDGAARMAFFFADYSRGLLGLRDGRFKMIYEVDSRRAKLYDLVEDAGEQRDVAQRDPDRAAWYVRNLRAWSASALRLGIEDR
jgi:glucan phosphoethanolaminetransferase (alkaline phosphatase superfamily)